MIKLVLFGLLIGIIISGITIFANIGVNYIYKDIDKFYESNNNEKGNQSP
jgi:hypothetical protein